jgi:large subunit ribosomal protein L46
MIARRTLNALLRSAPARRAALRGPRSVRGGARCASAGARYERKAYVASLRDRRDDLESRLGPAQLVAGVVVERTPALMPDPEDWELAMWELQASLEVHDGFDYPVSVGGGTSAEREAAPRKEIPEEIRALMNRETDADRAGDVRSLERKLAESLFLLVKDSAEAPWRLPAAALGDDGFLREACEGVLAAQCGPELYTYVLGNGPAGAWDAETAAGGLERTFFMRAIVVDLYTSGPVDPALTHDHTWVTKAELPDHIVGDAAYLDFLQKLL